MNLEKLIFNLKPVVFEAGDAIIEIYKNGAKAEYKEDGSPVTIADRLSEEIILKSLNSIAPNIPIVSEENSISHKKVFSDEFFLVDPLDGTKEFLDFSGSGEFTVNIGLISKNRPIMGIIYSPNSGQLYYGISTEGSFFENNNGEIFNYHELKETYKGKGFAGITGCDTELLAWGLDEFGLDFLDKLDSMHGFAYYDKRKQKK